MAETLVLNSPAYHQAHRSVRKARGNADEHPCKACGQQAKHWAYQHDTDPLDVANYEPMCVSCHFAYDGVRFDNNYGNTNLQGVKHWAVKLCEEDVTEIRKRCAAGQSQSSLAKEYGVSPMTISDVVSRKTWRHI